HLGVGLCERDGRNEGQQQSGDVISHGEGSCRSGCARRVMNGNVGHSPTYLSVFRNFSISSSALATSGSNSATSLAFFPYSCLRKPNRYVSFCGRQRWKNNSFLAITAWRSISVRGLFTGNIETARA